MAVPAGGRLRPGERLDDGVVVVRVAAVVDVVVEPLHVTELVERDRLGVVAAVGGRGVRLAPLERAPVEDVALLAQPHREPVRRVTGEAGQPVDPAGRARAVADRVRAAGVVRERRGAARLGWRVTSAAASLIAVLIAALGSAPARQRKRRTWSWPNEPPLSAGSGPCAAAPVGERAAPSRGSTRVPAVARRGAWSCRGASSRPRVGIGSGWSSHGLVQRDGLAVREMAEDRSGSGRIGREPAVRGEQHPTRRQRRRRPGHGRRRRETEVVRDRPEVDRRLRAIERSRVQPAARRRAPLVDESRARPACRPGLPRPPSATSVRRPPLRRSVTTIGQGRPRHAA